MDITPKKNREVKYSKIKLDFDSPTTVEAMLQLGKFK